MTISDKTRLMVVAALGGIVVLLIFLIFRVSLQSDLNAWLYDEEYSFALVVPLIGAYLIWVRRKQIFLAAKLPWSAGLFVIFSGCVLQVLASRSGSLVLSGIALILTFIGVTGFLWGKRVLQVVAGPLVLLIVMLPLPSYVMGEISWHLQSIGSTASGLVLKILGIPVLQEGNILRLANYSLEVKQACSGFRSIFALFVLTSGIALSAKSKLYVKLLLLVLAPVLAISANVIRVVGTGLIANRWGPLATNEVLHEAWGITVFLITVLGLLGTRALILRFETCRNA